MDTVDWASSSSVGANDVMLSDNLLDFVKDEDVVNSLSTNDDIFPQGESTNFTQYFHSFSSMFFSLQNFQNDFHIFVLFLPQTFSMS